MSVEKVLWVLLIAITITLLISLPFAWVVQWLWGWVMVGAFGMPALTFGQAWALYILSVILFKNTSVSTK